MAADSDDRLQQAADDMTRLLEKQWRSPGLLNGRKGPAAISSSSCMSAG